jgi:hypothetical protein
LIHDPDRTPAAPGSGSDRDRLVRWLSERGYCIRFRADVWHECLVSGHGEHWLGAGESAEDALDTAIRQAFPSRASQEILERALALPVEAPEPAVDGEREATVDPGRLGEDFAASAEPPGTEGPEAEAASAQEAAGAAMDEPPVPVRSAPGPADPVLAPPPSAAALPRRRFLTREDAFDALDHVREQIDSTVAETALASPVHQRMAISLWIAEARSIEESRPDDGRIEEIVHRIAQRLALLCKRWWPGTIRALQKLATPASMAEEWDLSEPMRFRFWSEVREALPSHFDAILTDEARRGLDEDGWADGPALAEPAPASADSLLDEVRQTLATATGRLDGPAMPPRDGKVPDLLALGGTLRWLRSHTERFEDWGDAIGRLRWLATSRAGSSAVRERIDPGWCPPMTWPRLLGFDPEKRRKQALRRRLLTEWVEAPPDAGEPLARWLAEALDAFPNARLAEIVGARRDAIAAVDPAAIVAASESASGRQVRRRLAALAKQLDASPPEASDRAAREQLAALGSAPDEPREPIDPHRELRESVAARTRGRRAAMIGNRADPELRARLLADLELSSLDWSEGEPRRVQALAEAARAGRYDLVLAATGFQSHAVDRTIARACRAAGVPLVRVNRARPLAVYLALSRDLAGASEPAR